MLTTTSLIPPFFFFLAVNRGCRSGMYCSYNDRSKNRVKKKKLCQVQSSENNFSQHLPIMIILRESSRTTKKKLVSANASLQYHSLPPRTHGRLRNKEVTLLISLSSHAESAVRFFIVTIVTNSPSRNYIDIYMHSRTLIKCKSNTIKIQITKKEDCNRDRVDQFFFGCFL